MYSCALQIHAYWAKQIVEDSKEVVRCHNPKARHYNFQKEKEQKKKQTLGYNVLDENIRLCNKNPIKIEDDVLGCSGRVGSRRVTLVKYSVASHEWRKGGVVIMTKG